MNNDPLVSVLVTVYNRENFLGEAIESIINQTYKNIEIIIVNDGSTDRTEEIIRSYMKKDERIILLNNNENIGIPKSENKALAVARGKYIARLDSDDIALPERIQTQVEFMESHPEIGVLGSNAFLIDEVGKVQGQTHLFERHELIHWTMLIRGCPMVHPSVMFRRKIDNEPVFYNENYCAADDWELWSRLINKTKFQNLRLPLVYYRDHKGNISKIKRDEQKEEDIEIKKRVLCEFLGVQIPDHLVEITRTMMYCSPNEARELVQWLNAIFIRMQEKYNLNPTIKAKIKEDIAARYILLGQNQDNLLSMAHFYYVAFKSSPLYFLGQLGTKINKIFKSFYRSIAKKSIFHA